MAFIAAKTYDNKDVVINFDTVKEIIPLSETSFELHFTDGTIKEYNGSYFSVLTYLSTKYL